LPKTGINIDKKELINLQSESNSAQIGIKKDEFLNNTQYLLPNRKSGTRFQK